jgi:hypothetical protein
MSLCRVTLYGYLRNPQPNAIKASFNCVSERLTTLSFVIYGAFVTIN